MNPNLFLIGFQKCGSSSLFDFLVQHPEIQGTSKKETFALTDSNYEHFEISNSVLNESFDWSRYFDFNQKAKYWLEGSVCNFYQETAQQYIANVPNAKAIMIVRDPIERFVSTYNYFGGSGIHLKPGTSLEEYLTIVQSKKTNKDAMNFALEHGAYMQYINRWRDLIGADNVLILGMKQVIGNPSKTAEDLCKFLEVQNHFPTVMSVKNQSQVVKNKQLHLLLRKIFGGLGLGKSGLSKMYQKMNKARPSKIEVKDSLKNTLTSYYDAEYKQLKNLF